MRRTREAKAETHEAIVGKAARLFRERGVERTSVGDVMAEAGLTHGGFYRHFDTKDALLAAALRASFDEAARAIEGRAESVGDSAAAADYVARYLTDEHVAHPGAGCPMPALASEIARGSQALRAEFADGFDRVAEALAKGLPGSPAAQRKQALRTLAMCVGAVLISRASDAETAADVLEACRET